MTSLEQKLLCYGDLPPSEQAEVERYVEQHPEWTPLLAESRALHALLRAAEGDRPDVAEVADYVLSHALDHDPTPERAAQNARVEAAFAAHPALERHAREMSRTLAQFAAESEDPVAHFERLTGRRLEGPAVPGAGTPPAAASGATVPTEKAPARTAHVLPWHPLRLALAASLALAVLYGALALSSHLAQPERVHLAALGDLSGTHEALQVRGSSLADEASGRYARALSALADARASVLGLFPRYDDAALDAVATDLHAVADRAGTGSWEGLEALYVLGRVRLHQGRDEEARWALQAVVTLDGPHAAEARRLLDYLRREDLGASRGGTPPDDAP